MTCPQEGTVTVMALAYEEFALLLDADQARAALRGVGRARG